MVINLIIFIILGVISYKICDKSFLEKETTKSIKDSTKIIFRISFILSNLILAFIILYIILPVYNFDIILWKLFLTFFSFYFFYFLPFYLIYKTFFIWVIAIIMLFCVSRNFIIFVIIYFSNRSMNKFSKAFFNSISRFGTHFKIRYF